MLALRIFINGIVQGVGFRPFVYRLAHDCGLQGWVLNSSEGVQIEAEGEMSALERFAEELRAKAPSNARIERFETKEIPPVGYEGFSIRESAQTDGWTLASPDLATCPACLADIRDIENRRFEYPFTNCTFCGPRYSILRELPYDRAKTTMEGFPLCPECAREFQNPGDRRFHAQPVCCPDCGPRLSLGLEEARVALKAGAILALKGLGGYQLAADATNESTMRTLRERKHRPDKPFALMVPDLEAAHHFAYLDPEEEKQLSSPAGPIVLARRKGGDLAPSVAPRLDRIGLMLPTTPLHHLLLARETGFPLALVMTSGNLSGEPLAIEELNACERLKGIADRFLHHDRPIVTPIDDSVLLCANQETVLVRRARGFAPSPIDLPVFSEGLLAVGGDLKCTFALTKGGRAILSQHIGDLADPLTWDSFRRIEQQMSELFRVVPRAVVADLHPDYFSTRFAQSLGLPCRLVQHHEAHIASCLAEHGVGPDEKVIGVAFDGTGYGHDGSIWGGEFFLGRVASLERRFHLPAIPLPGGNAAVKHPCRVAAATLHSWGIEGEDTPPMLELGAEASVIKTMVEKNLNVPTATSAGRLFDLVSSLLGIRHHVSYEGQAAMELEALALPNPHPYSWQLEGEEIRLEDLLHELLFDWKRGWPIGAISGRFHRTLAEIVRGACRRLREESNVEKVALSGGVFQNALLLQETVHLLTEDGFTVLTHRLVPANDGGLALGQAYLASILG